MDKYNVESVFLLDDKDVVLLLMEIKKKYGYDFLDYSRASMLRRVSRLLKVTKVPSFAELRYKLLNDEAFFEVFLKEVTVGVTEMFRDPDFYLAVRQEVVPILKTWSFIKVWHAGCSTGEEVYSMSILLKEEGLYERAQIYATDLSQFALKRAKEGIFPASQMKKYAQNYNASGAKDSFSSYFHARYDSAIMDSSLKENIVWANHNLVTDSDFTETHVIVCRNVLIYFNRHLQNRVHKLFHDSLVNGGILCLGNRESLHLMNYQNHFDPLNKKQKIYKKKYSI